MSATPEPGFRIERCGNLYVYIPIKPTAHALLTETSVSCA